MSSDLSEHDLFTYEELSAMYDVPAKTITNNCAKGKIEGVRIGRNVYVYRPSFEKWLKKYRPRPSNYPDLLVMNEDFWTAEEALSLIADILNKTRKSN